MNPWELHPALVHFPIAFLLSATAIDVAQVVQERKGRGRHALRLLLARMGICLLVAGVLSSLVAATAGVIAYFTVPSHSEAAQLRMLAHGLFAATATLVYAGVLLRRRKRPPGLISSFDLGLSITGAAVLSAAGALGGYLIHHDGVSLAGPRSAPVGTSIQHLERMLEGEEENP